MVVQLTSMFEDSTSLLLAYSLPLLLLSLVLAFSGTFLTLDRTRSFAPRSDPEISFPGSFLERRKPSKRWSFRLEGGVGGLTIGFIFGLHCVTFLTLLILNETSSKPLSPTAFFLAWLFSIPVTVALGGRWRVAALVFLGFTGGITLSLGLCIILHPTLSSRVILTSVITPLLTLIVVLPSVLPSLSQSNVAHWTARMSSSCSGAFSATLGVALLTRSPSYYSWANVWDRLWVANGSGWGTSRERGFDALFCALCASGALSDWALKRWIGENPEEKWDAYLADYSSMLPNANDRAGRFSPRKSPWRRLLQALHLLPHSPAHPHEIIFPSNKDFLSQADYTAVLAQSIDPKPVDLPRDALRGSSGEPEVPVHSVGVLRKGKSLRKDGLKPFLERNQEDPVFDLGHRPTFLQKSKGARVKRHLRHLSGKHRRPRVEFRPKEGFSSESDSEGSSDDDSVKTPIVSNGASPLTRMNSKASTVTLSGTTVRPPSSAEHSGGRNMAHGLDIDSEKARLMSMKASFGGVPRQAAPAKAPEYSDVEEDVTTAYASRDNQDGYDTPGWKPEFLRRALHADGLGALTSPRTAGNRMASPVSPTGAVPMTPSLINALGRIAKAQADAYGPGHNDGALPILSPVRQGSPDARREHVAITINARDGIAGLPVVEDDQQRVGDEKVEWDSFWNEIQVKAAQA